MYVHESIEGNSMLVCSFVFVCCNVLDEQLDNPLVHNWVSSESLFHNLSTNAHLERNVKKARKKDDKCIFSVICPF